MSAGEKIPTDGGAPLAQNPFGGLSGLGLRAASVPAGPPAISDRATGQPPAAKKNRGRVDITRQTMGRGGKTVTVVSGFVGIGQPEKEQLAKQMQKSCGAGGTVKDGCIEIQGDKRDQVAKILTAVGFRPVFAGG